MINRSLGSKYWEVRYEEWDPDEVDIYEDAIGVYASGPAAAAIETYNVNDYEGCYFEVTSVRRDFAERRPRRRYEKSEDFDPSDDSWIEECEEE